MRYLFCWTVSISLLLSACSNVDQITTPRIVEVLEKGAAWDTIPIVLTPSNIKAKASLNGVDVSLNVSLSDQQDIYLIRNNKDTTYKVNLLIGLQNQKRDIEKFGLEAVWLRTGLMDADGKNIVLRDEIPSYSKKGAAMFQFNLPEIRASLLSIITEEKEVVHIFKNPDKDTIRFYNYTRTLYPLQPEKIDTSKTVADTIVVRGSKDTITLKLRYKVTTISAQVAQEIKDINPPLYNEERILPFANASYNKAEKTIDVNLTLPGVGSSVFRSELRGNDADVRLSITLPIPR